MNRFPNCACVPPSGDILHEITTSRKNVPNCIQNIELHYIIDKRFRIIAEFVDNSGAGFGRGGYLYSHGDGNGGTLALPYFFVLDKLVCTESPHAERFHSIGN